MMKTLSRWALEYGGVLPFIFLAILAMSVPLGVASWVYDELTGGLASRPTWQAVPIKGFVLALCFYVYGFTLIVWAPTLNFLTFARLRPWRGPAVSVRAMPWYVSGTLTFIARYSFLEFVTPTPYNILFFRLMGMKAGHGIHLNTTAISDPAVIEIGNYATIGGSATITGHYSQGGFLIIAPTKIGAGATIGLRATLMGGVEVGEKAKVIANSFVLPNTKIPAGETWGGVPARKIDIRDFRQTLEVASASSPAAESK
jgi:hypothetical protein